VRALAVLVVLAHHTGPARAVRGLGDAGVTCFFTLSAYLITGILLRTDAPVWTTLRAFYSRRALRIFPAYYLLLAVLLGANIPELRATWGWHAAYLSNWFFVAIGRWPPAVGHFWTLAIEEQFYICWPWVVLLVPRQHLGRVCLALVAVGLVTRAWLVAPLGALCGVPTIAALDPLALGAWLAWSRARVRWPVALVGYGLALSAGPVGGTVYGRVAGPFGIALLSAWAIDAAARGRLPALFGRPMLQYIGAISYGIYLWHVPIAWTLLRLRGDDPLMPDRGSVRDFAIVLALTVVIASLSWFALERPLNGLKRFAPYPHT
jgi:peptidoglycan/LPS O-acetylase OafA/YrhL